MARQQAAEPVVASREAVNRDEVKPEVAAAGFSATSCGNQSRRFRRSRNSSANQLEHSFALGTGRRGNCEFISCQKRALFAGLIEGRETLEKIRAASGKVLGRTVRVCAKLESGVVSEARKWFARGEHAGDASAV